MPPKRKSLKVVWEHELRPTPFVDQATKPVPTRTPDTIGTNGVKYWFNEMASASQAKGPHNTNYEEAWIMDVCPRTGLLMTLNPYKLSWHIQPKWVQITYQNWVAERFLLDDSR